MSQPGWRLAIAAGKHAFKSLVTENVMETICSGLSAFRFTNSVISFVTESSIASDPLLWHVVAPLKAFNFICAVCFFMGEIAKGHDHY